MKLDSVDLHIHTCFSDGTCSVGEVVDTSRAKGLGTFAITDHYSEFSDLPPRMPKEQFVSYLSALDHAGVIKGVEVDVLTDGVSITAQSTKLCDLVLGGLHMLQGIIFWSDYRPILNPASFVENVRV